MTGFRKEVAVVEWSVHICRRVCRILQRVASLQQQQVHQGAVYTDDSKVDYQTGDSGTKYTPFNGALSASRSSSTYQDNAPVQQEATVICFCIKY